MKTIKELNSFDKPREKLIAKGAGALNDYELVAILIGSGIRGKDVIKLSKEIVNVFEKEYRSLNLETLLNIHGLGIVKASQILSSLELSKRYLIQENKKIISALHVYQELQKYHDKKQEYFIALYLDGANHLYEALVISIGTLNQSLVHPREVFSPAIENRCASIIVAHNHPSGILEASCDDIIVTQRLKDSGKLLGINLLDHIIFSKNGYISLKDEGCF